MGGYRGLVLGGEGGVVFMERRLDLCLPPISSDASWPALLGGCLRRWQWRRAAGRRVFDEGFFIFSNFQA